MFRLRMIAAIALFSLAGAWQPVSDAASASANAASKTRLSAAARRGQTFAQLRCSACHGVTANQSSPNPESPPFEDIANRTGVTRTTLVQFLRDSHNFPEAMNFDVENARINDLAAYIVTLKKPGYRPLVN